PPSNRAAFYSHLLDSPHAQSKASGGPFDAAERFPEADMRRVNPLPAGLLVSREQILAPAESTDRILATKAPGLDAQPPEILHRVARLAYFPIQHQPDAIVLAHDHVADAEISVHHGAPRPLGHIVRGPA